MAYKNIHCMKIYGNGEMQNTSCCVVSQTFMWDEYHQFIQLSNVINVINNNAWVTSLDYKSCLSNNSRVNLCNSSIQDHWQQKAEINAYLCYSKFLFLIIVHIILWILVVHKESAGQGHYLVWKTIAKFPQRKK